MLLLIDATRKRRAGRSLELGACLQCAATDFGEFCSLFLVFVTQDDQHEIGPPHGFILYQDQQC